MEIEFKHLPTSVLAKEIGELSEALAQVTISEMTATRLLANTDSLQLDAQGELMITQCRAALDQAVCARREYTALVIEMVDHFNTRPDRPFDLPITEAVRKMATQ